MLTLVSDTWAAATGTQQSINLNTPRTLLKYRRRSVPFTIASPVTATLIGFTTFTPVTGQQVSAPTVETVLFAGTAICTGRALPAVGTTCLILRRIRPSHGRAIQARGLIPKIVFVVLTITFFVTISYNDPILETLFPFWVKRCKSNQGPHHCEP